MNNQPGFTFANAYNGCADGFFPIDGMLLGNSYCASPAASGPPSFHPRCDDRPSCEACSRAQSPPLALRTALWQQTHVYLGPGQLPVHVAVHSLQSALLDIESRGAFWLAVTVTARSRSTTDPLCLPHAAPQGCTTKCCNGNQSGCTVCHNFSFTTEIHTQFQCAPSSAVQANNRTQKLAVGQSLAWPPSQAPMLPLTVIWRHTDNDCISSVPQVAVLSRQPGQPALTRLSSTGYCTLQLKFLSAEGFLCCTGSPRTRKGWTSMATMTFGCGARLCSRANQGQANAC